MEPKNNPNKYPYNDLSLDPIYGQFPNSSSQPSSTEHQLLAIYESISGAVPYEASSPSIINWIKPRLLMARFTYFVSFNLNLDSTKQRKLNALIVDCRTLTTLTFITYAYQHHSDLRHARGITSLIRVRAFIAYVQCLHGHDAQLRFVRTLNTYTLCFLLQSPDFLHLYVGFEVLALVNLFFFIQGQVSSLKEIDPLSALIAYFILSASAGLIFARIILAYHRTYNVYGFTPSPAVTYLFNRPDYLRADLIIVTLSTKLRIGPGYLLSSRIYASLTNDKLAYLRAVVKPALLVILRRLVAHKQWYLDRVMSPWLALSFRLAGIGVATAYRWNAQDNQKEFVIHMSRANLNSRAFVILMSARLEILNWIIPYLVFESVVRFILIRTSRLKDERKAFIAARLIALNLPPAILFVAKRHLLISIIQPVETLRYILFLVRQGVILGILVQNIISPSARELREEPLERSQLTPNPNLPTQPLKSRFYRLTILVVSRFTFVNVSIILDLDWITLLPL